MRRLGFFPWLWRLLFDDGREQPHACGEFTQWGGHKKVLRIVAGGNGAKLDEDEQYEIVQYYQQRRCTLCGKIFQENLVHRPADEGPLEDDDA